MTAHLHWLYAFLQVRYEEAYWEQVAANERWLRLFP